MTEKINTCDVDFDNISSLVEELSGLFPKDSQMRKKVDYVDTFANFIQKFVDERGRELFEGVLISQYDVLKDKFEIYNGKMCDLGKEINVSYFAEILDELKLLLDDELDDERHICEVNGKKDIGWLHGIMTRVRDYVLSLMSDFEKNFSGYSLTIDLLKMIVNDNVNDDVMEKLENNIVLGKNSLKKIIDDNVNDDIKEKLEKISNSFDRFVKNFVDNQLYNNILLNGFAMMNLLLSMEDVALLSIKDVAYVGKITIIDFSYILDKIKKERIEFGEDVSWLMPIMEKVKKYVVSLLADSIEAEESC